jgi:hypothetical protein
MRQEPAELKTAWASAAEDIVRGDLAAAENKILVGRAWSPGNPELILLLAHLRFAQAEREPDRVARGRLRFAAYQDLLAAGEALAGQPGYGEIYTVLTLFDGMRQSLCTGVESPHWLLRPAMAWGAEMLLRDPEAAESLPGPVLDLARELRNRSGDVPGLLQEWGLCETAP